MKPLFKKGDIVSFVLSTRHKETFSGIIVRSWQIRRDLVVYEISSMNHGMCSFSIGEMCVLKKLS